MEAIGPARSNDDRAWSPTPLAAAWPRIGNGVLFLLCAAFLAGPAYDSYLHYDFTHSPDAKSYVAMAQGDFGVNLTHRYRVVVPLLASGISMPIERIYGIVWPHRDRSEHHLRLGFFLVNWTLMALTGVILLRTCEEYGLSFMASCVGVLGILASRWSNCLASLPLVDSFHIFSVSLVFLAIKMRNGPMLALSIVLGGLSKESFVFIAPATLLFGNLRLWVQGVLYAVVVLLVASIHYGIDWYYPVTGSGSVQNAFDHWHNIQFSIRRACSVGGMGEIISVLGLFNLILVIALLQPGRMALFKVLDWPLWFLLISSLVQAVLSTSLARMLFVAAPFWSVLLAKGCEMLLAKIAWPTALDPGAGASQLANGAVRRV